MKLCTASNLYKAYSNECFLSLVSYNRHIELLVNHHSLSSALTMIENLLKSLKFKMFLHVAADHASRAVGATVLMEEYMDASNFGVSFDGEITRALFE